MVRGNGVNVYRFVLLLIALSWGEICFSKIDSPYAVNGAINLSAWNFETQGAVPLNGEWEFFWQSLRSPDDFERDAYAANVMPSYRVYGLNLHALASNIHGRLCYLPLASSFAK